ncbi:hypothetical protein QBC36DRAFT_167162, partial [Triangularia setosa]
MAPGLLSVWRRLCQLRVWNGMAGFGLVHKRIMRSLPLTAGRPVPLVPQTAPIDDTNVTETKSKQPIKRKRQRANKDPAPELAIVRGNLSTDATAIVAPPTVLVGPKKRKGRPALSSNNNSNNNVMSYAQPISNTAPPLPGSFVDVAAGPSHPDNGILNGHDSVSSMLSAQFASEIPAAPSPLNYGAGILNGHDSVSSMLAAQFASGVSP